MSKFLIANEKIKRGEQKRVFLKISEFFTGNPVNIPVIVSNGKKEGPVLFVIAAIHGYDINGTEIIRRLNSLIDPAKLKGTLITVPVANLFGFYLMEKNLPDGRDLNLSFPGLEKGSAASRIAKIIFDEIVLKSDFGIDIHTPGAKRYEIGHCEAEMTNDSLYNLANSFGANIIVNTKGNKKSLQYEATIQNKPTIVFSGGEILRFNNEITDQGVNGIMNVMNDLEMLNLERSKPDYTIIVRKSRSVQTNKGGFLYVFVKPGTLIYKGDYIACVSDPLGEDVEKIYAPENGFILSISTIPLVNPGMEVCAYVMLDKSLEQVERSKKGH